MFKDLRSSGLMKEISTNSVSIQKLNTEFVLISFIKPEERKPLNINISGYVNIIIEL